MLHEFVTANRNELILECKAKVSRRHEPAEMSEAIDNGVPIFLEQLIDTLRLEQFSPNRDPIESAPTPADTAIGRAAALDGVELLRHGYSIDQVVHGYGDVCQAITAFAVDQKYGIPADEFRTLNRCLDNAIADAVASFGRCLQASSDAQTATAQERFSAFSKELQQLTDVASQAFSAIRTGNVGLSGATGTLMSFALAELASLAERTSAGIVAPASASRAST